MDIIIKLQPTLQENSKTNLFILQSMKDRGNPFIDPRMWPLSHKVGLWNGFVSVCPSVHPSIRPSVRPSV